MATVCVFSLPVTAFGQSAEDGVARTGTLMHASTSPMGQNWSFDSTAGATHQHPAHTTSARLGASFLRNVCCGSNQIEQVRLLVAGSAIAGAPDHRVHGAQTALDVAGSFRLWSSLQSSLRVTAFDQFAQSSQDGLRSRNTVGGTLVWTRAFDPLDVGGQVNVYGGAGHRVDRYVTDLPDARYAVALAGATAEIPVRDRLSLVLVQSYAGQFSDSSRFRLGTIAQVDVGLIKALVVTTRYAFEFDHRSPVRSSRTNHAVTVEFGWRFKSRYPVGLI